MHRDQLRIAEPCHADWDAMSGDQKKRFCGSCTKHVHDLSSMTARQAERLVRKEADLCVRYSADADGRVIHRLPRLLALGAALLGATPAMASGAVVETAEPGLVERVIARVQQAVWSKETVVSQGQVQVMGELAVPEPPPKPEPREVMMMGRIAAPPTIRIPPPVVVPPVVIPSPAPGETVIAEVEEALRRQ